MLAMTAITHPAVDDHIACLSNRIGDVTGLDSEQSRHAGITVAVEQQVSVPTLRIAGRARSRDAGEPHLRNLQYGDRELARPGPATSIGRMGHLRIG